MLKEAIEKMMQLLLKGNIKYCPGDGSAGLKKAEERFTPLIDSNSHRFAELVIPLSGNAALKTGTKIINLTPGKIWFVRPHQEHCEGYVGKFSPAKLLWVDILASGPLFFISEHVLQDKQPQLLINRRFMASLPQARQLMMDGCAPDLPGNPIPQARFLSNILAACINAISEIEQTPEPTPTSVQQKVIEKTEEYINQHYTENIDIAELSEIAGYTPNYLGFLFKRKTGQAIHQYILQRRLNRAIALLKTGRHQVNEVADIVGYDDPLYFSRLFKRKIGKSPTEFLAKTKENRGNI
ncbi:MAG: AraC family transcriptional regulator [Phycisphaerae bacterium]|nr:AraC family transcriptional regulator [Phycisphaerae bacterium]